MMENGNEINYEQALVVTNRSLCKGDFLTQMQKVAALQPRGILLREKDLDFDHYAKLAEEMAEICAEFKVPLILHTYADLAKKLGCAGVHNSNRELTRDEFQWMSFACHSLEDVRCAEAKGANTIILGTIFETACKPGRKGSGLPFLAEICGETKLPVYAIGGIKPEHLPLLSENGAAGGCMMSYFANC